MEIGVYGGKVLKDKALKDGAQNKMINGKESFCLSWISNFCYESPHRPVVKRGDVC